MEKSVTALQNSFRKIISKEQKAQPSNRLRIHKPVQQQSSRSYKAPKTPAVKPVDETNTGPADYIKLSTKETTPQAKAASQDYTCPINDEPYYGKCPITRCPANIATRESGCLYNFLNGKRNIGYGELCYAFNLSTEEITKKIQKGERRIIIALTLNNFLNFTRDRYTKTSCCTKCGILRSTYGDCLNGVVCQERQTLVEQILTYYIFNIAELHITKKDIYILLSNIDKVEAYIKSTANNIKVNNLFGVNSKKFTRLLEIKTTV